jgi:peptidoglycan/xylan/chitin deacetylase (PgdA/CDA1 family)
MTRSLSARIRSAILGAASLGALAALPSSCSTPSKPQARPSSGESGKSDARKLPPEIDFSEQPTYIPNDTLSLTFDDGPLPPFTTEVLDVLKQHGVHATFFINTENNGNDVPGTPGNKEIVRRIVNEGHGLASHTVHHLSLKTLTPAQIETEITGVEAVVRDIFGTPAARLTLLRSPYGEPYQDYFYDHADPAGAMYPMVSSVVSKHAVHVGWNVETDDWKCTTGDAAANAGCVYEHFTTAVKTVGAPGAQWGIVLMHCVNPQTAAALPRILDYIEKNHFKLVSVEDVVHMRFGESSAEVVDRR